jgi:hypothetical protein
MPPRARLTRHNTPESKMAAQDLGTTEWERSKISNQDINLMKKLGMMKKKETLRFLSHPNFCNLVQWSLLQKSGGTKTFSKD